MFIALTSYVISIINQLLQQNDKFKSPANIKHSLLANYWVNTLFLLYFLATLVVLCLYYRTSVRVITIADNCESWKFLISVLLHCVVQLNDIRSIFNRYVNSSISVVMSNNITENQPSTSSNEGESSFQVQRFFFFLLKNDTFLHSLLLFS